MSRPQISSSSILEISPYVGGKSSAKEGVRVVKLSSNESPLGASPKAIAAFQNAAQNLHRYPDGAATALREAIGGVYNIPPTRIVCGCGSDELLGLLMHAYSGASDEVLINEHGFMMYKIYAQSFGASPVFVPEKHLRADVDATLAAVNERTKIVCLANPNNPTGSYITKAELHRLHAGLPPHVLLIVDGAYAEYATQDDYSCGRELVDRHDNVVMTRTFSKIYGLGGLRVGWAYAPEHIVDILNRIRSPFNVNTPAYLAAAEAVRDVEFTARAVAHNTQALAYMHGTLTQLGLTVYPSNANFVLVDFGSTEKAKAANGALADKGLIVREVAGYGLPTCLRITLGLDEDNQAVVATLTEFLKS